MYFPLSEFRQSPVTHIVSLGRDCATAYNLRRHFDFGGAFPFDWWVVEAAGLNRFLAEPDVDALYDGTKLELISNGASVRHREYGIQLHHEFPREWDVPRQPIRNDWREWLAKANQRTAALMRKFLALDAPQNRIVFVRQGPVARETVERLDALFPAADWAFAAIEVRSNDASDWKGDLGAWRQALDALGVTLDRTHHRPFEEKKSEPTSESLAAPGD